MVRFIMCKQQSSYIKKSIYIPIWLDLLLQIKQHLHILYLHLHSNMVRFIIETSTTEPLGTMGFKFQYGQIYYMTNLKTVDSTNTIYIPIWLDLLFLLLTHNSSAPQIFTFQYGQIYYCVLHACVREYTKIYIPIWLDLLFLLRKNLYYSHNDLHSNMVRFIILFYFYFSLIFFLFTFQYGQIYYVRHYFQLSFFQSIYIPIWLDLL